MAKGRGKDRKVKSLLYFYKCVTTVYSSISLVSKSCKDYKIASKPLYFCFKDKTDFTDDDFIYMRHILFLCPSVFSNGHLISNI